MCAEAREFADIGESTLADEAAVVARKRSPSGCDRAAAGSAAIDAALQLRIDEVVREVEEVLGRKLPSMSGGRPLEVANARLRTALSLVRGKLQRPSPGLDGAQAGKLVTCVLELQEVWQDVCDRQLDVRFDALGRVRTALGHLDGVDSTAGLIESATRELCGTCGFDRAILFRAEGPTLAAASVRFEPDPDWGETVLEFADRARPPLDQDTVESDARRRRRPLLVRDAQRDSQTYRPLVVATDTQSYVAAPIAPEGPVIGFMHADRYFAGEAVDELDRDVLSAFAEGFGHAAARTALLDRARSEHRRMRQMLAAADAAMSRICDARVALERATAEPEPPAGARDRVTPALTRRQRQIVELMAEGATNADIANRLVLSPDTVKFHVRQILKRMQAANRAEAVSRYLRLAGGRANGLN